MKAENKKTVEQKQKRLVRKKKYRAKLWKVAEERLKNLKTRFPYFILKISPNLRGGQYRIMKFTTDSPKSRYYTICDHGVVLRSCRQGCNPRNKKLQPSIVKKKTNTVHVSGDIESQ
jgi:hypothetical protein